MMTVDSLKKKLQKNLGEGDRLESLYQLVCRLYDQKSPECLDFIQIGKRQAESIGNLLRKGHFLVYEGNYYLASQDHLTAARFYEQALSVFGEIDDQAEKAKVLANLAALNSRVGDYKSAMKLYKRALRVQHELGDLQALALIYVNIGFLYNKTREYLRSLPEFSKAISAAHKAEDWRILTISHINYANACVVLKDVKRAKIHLSKAKVLADQYSLYNEKGLVLGNLGNVEKLEGNHDKALQYFNEALKLAKQYRIEKLEKTCYEVLSKTFQEKGNHEDAVMYLKLYHSLKYKNLQQETIAKFKNLEARVMKEQVAKSHELELLRNNELKTAIQKLEASREQLTFAKSKVRLGQFIGNLASKIDMPLKVIHRRLTNAQDNSVHSLQSDFHEFREIMEIGASANQVINGMKQLARKESSPEMNVEIMTLINDWLERK